MSWQGDGPPVLGIDLGGTKILGAVIGSDNRILGRAKRTTPAREGGPAIVEAMVSCVDEALRNAGLGRQDIAAAGIGSPGPLDTKSGVILFSSNLNVRNFPIGPELAAVLDRPVLVQNDVRVGGYAEFRLGAGRGYRDIVAAFVGTGIGGCVIQGGEMVAGLDRQRRRDRPHHRQGGRPAVRLRRRGCLEALASKTAIGRRVQKAVRKGLPTVLGDKMARKGGRLKSGDLAEAVAAKDIVALKEVHRAAHYLGLGLGSLINVLGPEIVIVGGGVAGALGPPTSTWSAPRRDRRPSPIPRASSASSAPPWATTPASSARPCWHARSSSTPDRGFRGNPGPEARHRPSLRSPSKWPRFGRQSLGHETGRRLQPRISRCKGIRTCLGSRDHPPIRTPAHRLAERPARAETSMRRRRVGSCSRRYSSQSFLWDSKPISTPAGFPCRVITTSSVAAFRRHFVSRSSFTSDSGTVFITSWPIAV